jgi:hypothetical protein
MFTIKKYKSAIEMNTAKNNDLSQRMYHFFQVWSISVSREERTISKLNFYSEKLNWERLTAARGGFDCGLRNSCSIIRLERGIDGNSIE